MQTPTVPRFPARSLVCAGLLLIASAGRAQNVNTTQFTVAGTGNGGPTAQLFPAMGGWLAAGSIRFSNDSSRISLLRFSPQLAITRSRHYVVAGARPNTNLGPFVAAPGGLIGRGAASGQDCLFAFDSAFALRWGAGVPFDLSNSVMRGRRLVVAYSTAAVTSSNRSFTRVWCDARTGTGWRGRRCESSTSGWRVTDAYAPDSTGTHYLTGDADAPLIKLDTTKVYWAYLLSAGGSQAEIGQPKLAANGNLWVPLRTRPAATQPTEAVICRFDTAGNVLSARKLALPSRSLAFTDIHELPGGDLLLAGYARAGGGGKFQPMIFRLTAAGALVWAHRWDLGTSGPVGGVPTIVPLPGGRYRLFNSDMAFIDLDANFNGCQFVDETANITVSAATITRTPLPLTMTTIAVAATPATLINRSFAYTPSLVCTAVGLAEEKPAASTTLAAWPQPLPRGERLHLNLPVGWYAADTRLTLTSALGQTVWRGPWAEAVALPAGLPPGVWTLTATSGRGGTLRRRVLVE